MDIEREDEDAPAPAAGGMGEVEGPEATEEMLASAEEALAPEGQLLYEEEVAEAPIEAEVIMAEAHHDSMRARAAWSLVHKELLLLLMANCLFLAGALASWGRMVDHVDAGPWTFVGNGLDTIRGSLVFALAIYGFWTSVFNIWSRQLIVWPFLLNALLGLWVGIGGFAGTIGSTRWANAQAYLDRAESVSMLDRFAVPLSTIPPGHWLLTAGGALVLVILLKGVLGGASRTRAAAAAEDAGGGRRRRR